jgi:DNA mismatch endonuclease, patch repair protein
MSRQRTAGTQPELAIRSELHRRGLRYRVNARGLPGRPDIVFTRARIAVQVDGCFWHGCPEHGSVPKSNTEWWRTKLEANRERDVRNDATLSADGWLVIRVWEHDDPSAVADTIEAGWRARTGRST